MRAGLGMVAAFGAVSLTRCLAGSHAEHSGTSTASRRAVASARTPATPMKQLLSGARGRAVGRSRSTSRSSRSRAIGPAADGAGSFVPLDRANERKAGFGVKVMTIVKPSVEGTITLEARALDARRRAAWATGPDPDPSQLERRRSIRLHARDGQDQLLAGGMWFSGPGCYQISVRPDDRSFDLTFPVGFSSRA